MNGCRVCSAWKHNHDESTCKYSTYPWKPLKTAVHSKLSKAIKRDSCDWTLIESRCTVILLAFNNNRCTAMPTRAICPVWAILQMSGDFSRINLKQKNISVGESSNRYSISSFKASDNDLWLPPGVYFELHFRDRHSGGISISKSGKTPALHWVWWLRYRDAFNASG